MAEEKEERATENTTVHKSNMCISCIALQCIVVLDKVRTAVKSLCSEAIVHCAEQCSCAIVPVRPKLSKILLQ